MTDPIAWSAASGRAVFVCRVGARTPLGVTAASAAAAVRGAISAVAAHPVFTDKADEPIAMAWDSKLAMELGLAERMGLMLMSAMSEALGRDPSSLERAHVPWVVGLPEARPGLPRDLARQVASMATESGFSPTGCHILERGHAAGLMAMQLAARRISAGDTEVCLAAGVDSYHDGVTLEWLDKNGFLMSPSNRNGFPPGEGAGACLMASAEAVEKYDLSVVATVVAASTATERHTIRGNDVCIGTGLTAAISDVISALRLPEQRITTTYTDLNGQRYRSEEFMYAMLRTSPAFVNAHDYVCPADCWGDVGAASGALFASLAAVASERGYASGLFPLLWAGSESGYRTAIVLKLAAA